MASVGSDGLAGIDAGTGRPTPAALGSTGHPGKPPGDRAAPAPGRVCIPPAAGSWRIPPARLGVWVYPRSSWASGHLDDSVLTQRLGDLWQTRGRTSHRPAHRVDSQAVLRGLGIPFLLQLCPFLA